MSSLLRYFALCSTLVLGACSGEDPAPPIAQQTEPIVGGVDDTGAQAHPAVVMLFNGNGACTGSLIAPKLVLTARHCVSQSLQEGIGCDIYGSSTNGAHFGGDPTPSSIQVFTGATPNFGSPVAAGAQLFHPPGDNACNNDIALVVLNKAVTGITPLKVRLDWGPVVGEMTTAVGYGAVNDFQQGSGKRRRRANVPVLTAGQDWNHVTGAGELAVGQAACSGDSGGPVISAAGGVIGVASRVFKCSDPNTSAKYVRLDYHKDLILQAFAAAGASPSLEPGSAPPPPVKKQVGEGPCQTGSECASAMCQTAGGYCTNFCGSSPCTSSSTYCADSQIVLSGQIVNEKLCVLLPTGTPCEACRSTQCVNATATCLNNAACKQLLACADACTDAACLDACVAQNPAGADDYETVRYCGCESSCSNVCSHLCVGSAGAGGGAGSGGQGGSGAGGGAAGSGGTGAGAGSGAGGGQAPATSGTSGGCAIAPRAPATPPTWLLLSLALALGLSRRAGGTARRSRRDSARRVGPTRDASRTAGAGSDPSAS